ncbi:unnamed protein product [Bemisia tabaci]|uniref:Ubinuclein-2 n=1 Tax=Bemisia tabaci TaxID=7038 RepID=A0A9P0F3Z3_BEMTA|nr:unnamed protein product [Bemisia tabaci]
MSEQHRVAFTTLGSAKKQAKSKPKSDSVRITINLTEPSGDSCPVFSYTALVNSVERKKKKDNDKVANGSIDHIHDCDEEQLKRIAAQYEDKYGTKEKRFSNYNELGAGYDDGDSFIDNSEALDEALSEQVEPEFGGYYVNIGPLQLKHLDGSENSEDEEINMRTHNLKRAAKAIVSDSEESEKSENEEEEEEEDVDKDDSREENHTATKHKVKIAETKDVNNLKSENVPNETDQIRNKSNGEIRVKKQKRKLDPSTDNHVEKKKKKLSKSLTVKKLLEEKRIADASPGLSRNGDMSDPRDKVADVSPPSSQVPSLSTSANQMNLNSNPYIHPNKDIVPLPAYLPDDVLEIIKYIKQYPTKFQHLSKGKFFSDSINKELLRLECKSRDLDLSRHQIYAHLACFVPCGKETLMKRAKNLLIDVEGKKLESLIKDLKVAVDRIMPSILEKHSEACQKASKEKYIEDSVSGCASSNSETRPKTKVPRRSFPWNDELKSYVRQILEVQLRIFKLVKSRKDTVEDFVQKFVANKLKPLWPHGWMKVSTILKVADLELANFSKKNTPTTNYQKKINSAVAINNSSTPVSTNSTPTPLSTVPEPTQLRKLPAANSVKDKFKETSLPEMDMFSDPIDLLSKITSAISPNSQQNCKASTSPQLQTSQSPKEKLNLENENKKTETVISRNNFNIDHLMDLSKRESCSRSVPQYSKSNDQVLDLSPGKTSVSPNKTPETEGMKPVSLKHRILQESMKAQAESDSFNSLKKPQPLNFDGGKSEPLRLPEEKNIYSKAEADYQEDSKKSTYENIIKQCVNEMKPPPPAIIKDDPGLQERKVRSQSVEECEASMEAVIKSLQDLQKMSGNKINTPERNFSMPHAMESVKLNNNIKPVNLDFPAVNHEVESPKESTGMPKVALGFQAEFYKHLLSDSPKEKTPSRGPEVPELYRSYEDSSARLPDPVIKIEGNPQPSAPNHCSVIVPVSANQSGWHYRDQNHLSQESPHSHR